MPETAKTDILGELKKFSILKIERPFLKWKDSMIPPGPQQLDKRVAKYVDAYLHGGDTAIPIIWDAIKGGANPDQMVAKAGGTEPLIVKAAHNDAFFLVQALGAAGANINAKSSDGETALMAAAKIASVTISSYLLDQGAEAEMKQVLGGANPALADAASMLPFNSTAAPGAKKPTAAATNTAAAPKAQTNAI